MRSPRYSIGIDLGTTNSALAYVDVLEASRAGTTVLTVEQDTAAGVRSALPILPSAVFLDPATGESRVGKYALDEAGRSPESVILSAKSWLAFGGVDRDAKILPWRSRVVPDGNKLSPVDASAAILRHLKEVWDGTVARFEPAYRLEHQLVTITVPASFDEAALKLTREAARRAGFGDDVRLLEEPQAAFYRYLEAHSKTLSRERPGMVLVVDVGGGTTDFSLFTVSDDARAEVKRVAVSDHILLGGDNIDHAVAWSLDDARLRQGGTEQLTARQRGLLVLQARFLKEVALGDAADPEATLRVSIPGEGALFAGAISFAASVGDILRQVLESFYPIVSAETRPEKQHGGLFEWGLPYAKDSRITAHLAEFLGDKRVDAVLFNGGSLASEAVRRRLIECLTSWAEGSSPVVLDNGDLDLAVARGAAWYGSQILSGEGRRITGGYPRSLYVELAKPSRGAKARAVCVVPKGFATSAPSPVPDNHFAVVLDKAVRFQMWASSTRDDDSQGAIVDVDPVEFRPLASLTTKLELEANRKKPQDGKISVDLFVALSEAGLLELTCREQGQSDTPSAKVWKLEFNTRVERTDSDATKSSSPSVDRALVQSAIERIDSYFGKPKPGEGQRNPKKLFRELEETLRQDRRSWPIEVLRTLWPAVARGVTRRARSPAHEEVWCQIAGLVLRPGRGFDGDTIRMDEVWRAWTQGLSNPRERACAVQWWILWRRVAAGLQSQRQEEVFSAAFQKVPSANPADASEMYRTLGSLERVSHEEKIRAARHILAQMTKLQAKMDTALPWALGRICGRLPVYGGPECVIDPRVVGEWAEEILDFGLDQPCKRALISMARLVPDPDLNLSDSVRQKILSKLRARGVPQEELEPMLTVVIPDSEEARFWAGDELPAGLSVL